MYQTDASLQVHGALLASGCKTLRSNHRSASQECHGWYVSALTYGCDGLDKQ